MSSERRSTAQVLTSGLLGAAVGLGAGVWIARSGPQVPDLDVKGPTAPAASESGRAASVETPVSSARPSSVDVEREAVADVPASASGESDELAQLRQRIAELEGEIVRLEKLVREGEPQRQQLEEFFAANDLQHEELWRDLFSLLFDAEQVVAEPERRILPLLLRVVDETGLAAAPRENAETRSLKPEPASEETWLNLTRSASDTSTQLQLQGVVTFPERPEGWLGDPANLGIEVIVERGSNGNLQFCFGLEARNSLHVDFTWEEEACFASRRPWRGDSEERELPPDALPAMRAAIERFFEQLETRAR